jgi:hypothetical protein
LAGAGFFGFGLYSLGEPKAEAILYWLGSTKTRSAAFATRVSCPRHDHWVRGPNALNAAPDLKGARFDVHFNGGKR